MIILTENLKFYETDVFTWIIYLEILKKIIRKHGNIVITSKTKMTTFLNYVKSILGIQSKYFFVVHYDLLPISWKTDMFKYTIV